MARANIGRREATFGLISVLGVAPGTSHAQTEHSAASRGCLAVDPATGKRPAYLIPPVKPTLQPVRSLPVAWRQNAIELAALFESGSRDLGAAYKNVSVTDVLSIGFLQWNHNAGSLYDRLLSVSDDSYVSAAPSEIRDGVSVLVKVAHKQATHTQGKAVLEGWQTGGKVKPKVLAALKEWLVAPVVKARQDALIEIELQRALQLADSWQVDNGSAIADNRDTERAFYFFIDVGVFNGDLAGLWAPHVQALRAKFKSDKSMLAYFAGWISECQTYRFKGMVTSGKEPYKPKFEQVYRRRETRLNIALWQSLYDAGDIRVDKVALALMALGFLRAEISHGNDKPRGFHGMFQLDVFNRRGLMATGYGYETGASSPTTLYKLAT